MSALIRALFLKRNGMSLIILLPLILVFTAFTISVTRTTTVSDVNVQQTVALAAKAGCMAVSPMSQANADPRVKCDDAHNNFRWALQKNLGLDANMNPLPGSPLKSAPDYVFVVYNGDDTYLNDNAGTGVRYTYSGGTLSTTSLIPFGFPAQFALSSLSAGQGAGGSFTVTLDRPGTIALINAKGAQVTSLDNINIERWASAKIVLGQND